MTGPRTHIRVDRQGKRLADSGISRIARSQEILTNELPLGNDDDDDDDVVFDV